MKTKTCKGCGNEFILFVREGGRSLNLCKRSYCLICSPYGELRKNQKPLVDGLRECTRCHQLKPLTEFKPRGRVRALRSCCTRCETERVADYGRRLKQRAVAYLGGMCSKCGYNKSLRSLIFHHTDPSKKDFTIGKKKCLKWDTIQPELDKCVLLCANCHGEAHDHLDQQHACV